MKIRVLLSIFLLLVVSAAEAEPGRTGAPEVGGESGEAALSGLLAGQPRATLVKRALTGSAMSVVGLSVETRGETPRERAEYFLFMSPWGEALGLTREVLAYEGENAGAGRRGVTYRQVYEGRRVLGKQVVVLMDEGGRVVSVSSDVISVRGLSEGAIEEDEARRLAAEVVPESGAAASAERVVLSEAGGAVVAWRVAVSQRGQVAPMMVLVDTRDGRILGLQRPSRR